MKYGYFTWVWGWIMLIGGVVLIVLGITIDRTFLKFSIPLFLLSYFEIRKGHKIINDNKAIALKDK